MFCSSRYSLFEIKIRNEIRLVPTYVRAYLFYRGNKIDSALIDSSHTFKGDEHFTDQKVLML